MLSVVLTLLKWGKSAKVDSLFVTHFISNKLGVLFVVSYAAGVGRSVHIFQCMNEG